MLLPNVYECVVDDALLLALDRADALALLDKQAQRIGLEVGRPRSAVLAPAWI